MCSIIFWSHCSIAKVIIEFYVCMTVRRNRLKWIKPTVALNSNFIGMMTTCFGQPFCPSSGVLSRTSAQNSWWWAEGLPKTCRVIIPIKLEFSASVGFIHFNNWMFGSVQGTADDTADYLMANNTCQKTVPFQVPCADRTRTVWGFQWRGISA